MNDGPRIKLDRLRDYPTNLRASTVADAQHRRAKNTLVRGAPAHRLELLADAIHAYAVDIVPHGDLYRGPLVAALLHTLIGLLNEDTGGWDATTVDSWARYVAVCIDENPEEL
jgi:hypothetical protein